MKIQFSTTKYEFSNGKTPRGNGHWVFECKGTMYSFSGIYGDAKASAKKFFSATNTGASVLTIIVCA